MLKFTKVLTQENMLIIYAYRVICIDDKFSKSTIIYRSENAAYEFIKAIHQEHRYFRQVMKKHFNENLVMTEEEEHLFQESNICWICKKLIDNDDEKIRGNCRVTGKVRGSAHWDCNIK